MNKAFRVDQYQAEREGWSTWLKCSCSTCESNVATYQKDGPGPLLRCYFNRFAEPSDLAKLKDCYLHEHYSSAPIQWRCHSCQALLGKTIKYRDGRLAFEIVNDAITVVSV